MGLDHGSCCQHCLARRSQGVHLSLFMLFLVMSWDRTDAADWLLFGLLLLLLLLFIALLLLRSSKDWELAWGRML